MIYKDGHKINRINIDGKEIYKVYFNDKVVFRKYHPVTAIVATTHDQWIETDMKDFWVDELDWEICFSVNVNSTCIFGCRPDKGFQEYGFIASDSATDNYLLRMGGEVVGSTSPDAIKAPGPVLGANLAYPLGTNTATKGKTSGVIYDIKKIETIRFVNKEFYLNGVKYNYEEQKGYPFFLTYLPFHIFRYNQIDYDTDSIDNSNGIRYLYYARFWLKGQLYRDFIPVLDEYGNAALYEKITKKFYYSAGPKTLEYIDGNYSPVTCIYNFSKTSYADTGILPKDIGKWEIRLQYSTTTALTNYTNCGFGCIRQDNTGFYFKNMGTKTAATHSLYRFQIGNQTIDTEIPINTIDEVNLSIDMINKVAKINNDSFPITDVSSLEDLPSLIIGAMSDNNTILNEIPNMRVYQSKIYNKNGELIQHLKPYLDRQQKIGIFYDILNEVPYKSAGTSEFQYI